MSEIRRDKIYRRDVIIAKERGNRPQDFNTNNEEESTRIGIKEDCPFCIGNEAETPDNYICFGEPWKIRVIKNKYPIVRKCLDHLNGYHYVVIECREHFKKISEFKKEEFIDIFNAYREVLKGLYKDESIKKVQIFKNYGSGAGASLEHPHSQIVALNIDNDNLYFGEDKCLLCEEIQEEIANKERVIVETDNYICYMPFAAAYSYEIRICPKAHKSSFLNDLSNNDIDELAEVYVNIFNIIFKSIGDVPLNICYNFKKLRNEKYHMFIEIVPRTSMQAGFELSTGIMINTKAPEDAAKLFRRNMDYKK